MIICIGTYVAEAGRTVAAYRAWLAGTVLTAALIAGLGLGGLTVLGGTGEATAAPAPPTAPAPGPAPTVPGPEAPPTAPTDPADTDYEFLFGDTPVGFDPCVPAINVSYNPAGAPYPAEADLTASVDLLAEGLGRPVTYTGTTNSTDPDTNTILVTWVATPADLDAGPDVVGQAAPENIGGRIVSATVALVASGDLSPGLGADAWGVVMIHELGHAVGLNHVTDDTEIMYPSVVPDQPAEWGNGDINGLRQVAGTCTENNLRTPGGPSTLITIH